jgi:putative phosphoribosyl transferase
MMYKPFRDCEETLVTVNAGSVQLPGTLVVPHDADFLVLCVHNSGQWQHNPRNHYFTHLLRQSGYATLLIDLLTPEEEEFDARMGRMRFNTDLLAARLKGAVDWTRDYTATRSFKLGLFGAGNAANTVLLATAERPQAVDSIVICNGPLLSLVALALPQIQIPTLLIAGAANETAVDLHRATLAQLSCMKQLAMIPNAVRPFEESGAIEEVARLSHQWYKRVERASRLASRFISAV